MKIFILLIFLQTSLTVFSQSKALIIKERNLDLAVGIDQVIKFERQFRTDKIEIAKPSILKLIVVPSKREITFRGLNPGQTSVTIYDAKTGEREMFNVKITADGLSNVVKELRALIGEVEGVEIKIKGGKVVVEGSIVVPGQIGRINTVLSGYQDVLVLIEYAPQTQVLVAREMQEAIRKNGMNDVAVRVVNGDYWLEGVVNSDAKRVLAQTIAEAYLPDTLAGLGAAQGGQRFSGKEKGKVRSLISVNVKKDPEPPKKLIKVSAQFVELAKDYSKIFAFKWAPFMSTDSSISFAPTDSTSDSGEITTKQSGTLAGTISRLFPKITSAKEAGYVRVLQSGMLVTTDGQAASISKSSTVTFSVGSGVNADTSSSTISFNLSVTPKIQAQEAVLLGGLKISVELPSGHDNKNNPLSTKNTINTNIVVKAKESAVVGGIVQNTSTTSYDKNDPDKVQPKSENGEQVSELFKVLRSKAYKTSKSQFVVFVTPEILESASEGTEEIRKKFRKRER